jgi:hypothetical protein
VALQSLRDLPSAPRHLILPFMRHYRAVNPIEVFDSYIGVFAPARAAGRKRASNSKCLRCTRHCGAADVGLIRAMPSGPCGMVREHGKLRRAEQPMRIKARSGAA